MNAISTRLPDEIQISIYSLCGIREIGRLSQVSKQTSQLANVAFIWQSFCHTLVPYSRKHDDTMTWKEFYLYVLNLNQYRGKDTIFVQYVLPSNSPILFSCLNFKLVSMNIRVDLESFTVLELKKLIKLDKNLPFALSDFSLCGKSTEALDDSDSIPQLIKNKTITHLPNLDFSHSFEEIQPIFVPIKESHWLNSCGIQ